MYTSVYKNITTTPMFVVQSILSVIFIIIY
uniref:Uncharacterized protein n=1 Tax=Anguilla anguilla TaxID=7936 RepID=A0A0E9VQI4_ANGAN